jgi:hypothetical protein
VTRNRRDPFKERNMNRSLSVVVLAAIPISLRSSVASDSFLVTLGRLVARPFAQAMKAARRPARAENDDATRVALMRDGFSIDERRFRGGVPRNLDHAHYDILRQIR